MPELITAALTPPPATPSSSAGKGPQATGNKSSSDGVSNSTESRRSEGEPAAKEATPFSAVLQKQMAKKDGGTTDQAQTAKVDMVDPALAIGAADANAAMLAALAAEMSALQKPAADAANAAETLATDVSSLIAQTSDLANTPVTAAITTFNPLTIAIAAQQSGLDDQPHFDSALPRSASTGIEQAVVAADGKINLDTAITAERASRESKQGEMDFQVLIDAHAQRAQAPQTQSTSQVSSAPVLHIDTPAGQAGWREEVGQKLTWMAAGSRQQADLVLTPPSLGRVEVSLSINGDQASAVFASTNANVRDMIEDSLPRLREILAESGINLGQTHVGSDSASQSAQQQKENSFGGRFMDEGLTTGSVDLPLLNEGSSGIGRGSAGRGMVDIFA